MAQPRNLLHYASRAKLSADVPAQAKTATRICSRWMGQLAHQIPHIMEQTIPPIPGPSDQNRVRKSILIVDDHPLFRHGITALVSQEPGFRVCAEAAMATTALEAMRQFAPDAALLDISLPGADGIELIKQMHAEQPGLRIVVLSMYDESLYALRALKAGAKGYVMKNAAANTIIAALHRVLEGHIYVSSTLSERLIFNAIQSIDKDLGSPMDKLSDRELEVMEHLGKGRGTREIAQTLNLSIKTIESHRAHIKEKFGFKDSGEMVRYAIDWMGQEAG